MIVVFVGPTLSLADACRELDAEYLPPAAQGDVYRAVLERPAAIGLIDGYFHQVPAVWHKEILWAMAQGVRVYGAASMGALRAAELADFGMHGTGWVFEAYRSGALEDDDEVAVAHAPEAYGFRPASEAMVNIRRTLQRARDEQVLDHAAAALLVQIAKALFYADRSYERVLLEAQGRIERTKLDALRAWLPGGAINQKREDALAMLRGMRQAQAEPAARKVSFAFEHTAAWELARSRAGARVRPATAPNRARQDELDQAVLTEVRLAGLYKRVHHDAVTRALALDLARRDQLTVEGAVLHEAIGAFRRERELASDDQFEQWLEAQEIGSLDFFAEESLVQLTRARLQPDALCVLGDQLRSTGDYAHLAARARDKERVLQRLGRALPGADEAALIDWFCTQRMRAAAPADTAQFARQLAKAWGLESQSEVIEALRDEYLYTEESGPRQEPS